ncbi:Hypothetical_protein [Hexamita inflata]|uniref:Hypothetical_protein n=1 Tax=Hexamita inflata TaxID=28002 RepID=A0AA86QI66_9EUKA|nr:Hypothetical protein HINF_LOCUS46790 [Hexamita inflata]CAI9962957.1 Hypothetical protein HINF_LOCUS50602 [Hexamita inflata]
MNSFVMSSERISKKVVYQTRFIADHDVKHHSIVQKLDNAEIQGNLFFGTDFYCNVRLPDYKITDEPQTQKSSANSSAESFRTKLVKIEKNKFMCPKGLMPRPKSPSRIFQEIKSGIQKEEKGEGKKAKKVFSVSERLLLENLNQLDISIESESEDTKKTDKLVKNESGKLIQVVIPTYQRSERTRRMLEVQMDELALIQMQINKNIAQLQ